MNEFKYTGKAKMSREEFDSRHYEVIEWARLWDKLFYVFILFFFASLFTGSLLASAIVIGAQMLFIVFNLICRHRHDKLHEKYEAQDGE